MPFTEEEKDEDFIKYSGIDRHLYFRWKIETANGTREPSVELNVALLLSALRRDHAVNPNLDQYAFLTPEKKAEIAAEFHRDIPAP